MSYTRPLILFFATFLLTGLWRLRRDRGQRLIVFGTFGLLLTAWPPFDWLASRPLEIWYPVKPPQLSHSAQAIVVLAAAVSPPLFERPYPIPDHETYQRCEFAAWLQRQYPSLPILACGGRSDPGEQPFSVEMRQLLRRDGVPDEMIWTEELSHTTHENALYGSEILRQRGIGRIALVVDARSMPRATACFRKCGIKVYPAPSSFREFDGWGHEWIPSDKAIASNELTLHETLGLAWYSLHGWL